jgi:hypothetical protein
VSCIYDANQSAAALVNLLAENFDCFRDEASLNGRRVRFYKRAQILVADLWACFEGEGYGEFHDIEKITMFAGMYYRMPSEENFLSLADMLANRLPHPPNALSARVLAVLAPVGESYPPPPTHQEWVDVGD